MKGPWRRLLKLLRNKVSRHQIETLQEDLSINDAEYDLIHVPVPQGLIKVDGFNTKILTTVHDTTHLVFPEFHEKENILETEEGMQLIRSSHSSVMAVSKCTRNDLMNHYKWPEEDIAVVYEGIDPDVFHPRTRGLRDEIIEQKYNCLLYTSPSPRDA